MATVTRNLVATPVDLMGEFLGLRRYELEDYHDYIDRLRKFYSMPGTPNAGYFGLLWGLLTDLNLPLIPYAKILSTDYTSEIITSISGITLTNSTETISVPFFTVGVTGGIEVAQNFTTLIEAITGSSTFTIEQDILGVDLVNPEFTNDFYSLPLKPYNLLFDSNKRLSDIVPIPIDRDYVQLPNPYIVSGSMVFDDMSQDFVVEVATSGELDSIGDYLIDYTSGQIWCYLRQEKKRMLNYLTKMNIDDFSALSEDDYKRLSMRNWEIMRVADQDFIPVNVRYFFYDWPFRLFLTPIQIFKWTDPSLEDLFYNIHGNVSTLPRVELPVVTEIFEELRSLHASY